MFTMVRRLCAVALFACAVARADVVEGVTDGALGQLGIASCGTVTGDGNVRSDAACIVCCVHAATP